MAFSVPLILGVTMSVAVSRFFGPSIFTLLGSLKGIQFLDELKIIRYTCTAGEIMETDFIFLTKKIQLAKIAELVEIFRDITIFPVVKSEGCLYFFNF
jgi:hypothetical protein